MTTPRDVIIRHLMPSGCGLAFTLQEAEDIADAVLAALISAPDSVRLELAAQLNPWREGPPPETADTEVTINGRWWRHLLPGAPPSEDKP